MRFLLFLLFLMLIFSFGCISSTTRSCDVYLQPDKYSETSYVACVEKKALSLASEGRIAEAVNECKNILNNIKIVKFVGFELGDIASYNKCIKYVAVVSKDPSVCKEIYAKQFFNAIFVETLSISKKIDMFVDSGLDLDSVRLPVYEAECVALVNAEIRKERAILNIWDRILEGFDRSFQ